MGQDAQLHYAKGLLGFVGMLLRALPARGANLLLILARGVPTVVGVAGRHALVRRMSRRCGFPVVTVGGVGTPKCGSGQA